MKGSNTNRPEKTARPSFWFWSEDRNISRKRARLGYGGGVDRGVPRWCAV